VSPSAKGNISTSFDQSFKKKSTFKASLDQGRKRIDPYKISEMKKQDLSFSEIEDET